MKKSINVFENYTGIMSKRTVGTSLPELVQKPADFLFGGMTTPEPQHSTKERNQREGDVIQLIRPGLHRVSV